jgi:hypothetical protein
MTKLFCYNLRTIAHTELQCSQKFLVDSIIFEIMIHLDPKRRQEFTNERDISCETKSYYKLKFKSMVVPNLIYSR